MGHRTWRQSCFSPSGQDAPLEAAALTELPSPPFVVKSVYLECTKMDDEGLAPLAGLTELDAVRLNRTGVTALGMIRRKELPTLSFLEFAGMQVGDGGMASVGTLRELRWLTLDGNPVTYQGSTHLQGSQELESLRLNRQFRLPIYFAHDDIDAADDGGDVGDQAAFAHFARYREVGHA